MKKVILFFAACALFSCSKPGPGGSATIKGVVKHHTKPIPGAVVYIKYNATESPGTNITYYDASVNTDANANYIFNNLKRGNYYLFGIGFDSAIVKTVIGGTPTKINGKTETVTIDVPVTE